MRNVATPLSHWRRIVSSIELPIKCLHCYRRARFSEYAEDCHLGIMPISIDILTMACSVALTFGIANYCSYSDNLTQNSHPYPSKSLPLE
jgi:hypothetical protein